MMAAMGLTIASQARKNEKMIGILMSFVSKMYVAIMDNIGIFPITAGPIA